MVDFNFYKTIFFGVQISEEEFPRFSSLANDYIAFITQGRSKNTTGEALTAVKKAICAVGELIQQGEQNNSIAQSGGGEGVVSGESNDGFSVSYVVNDTSTEAGRKSLEASKMLIASQYLLWTGLLYRGVPLC